MLNQKVNKLKWKWNKNYFTIWTEFSKSNINENEKKICTLRKYFFFTKSIIKEKGEKKAYANFKLKEYYVYI